MSERETLFRQMVTQFPDSQMGHFSLGRLLVDEKRWDEAVASLSNATRIDPNYAAAWVALGDAHAGAGRKEDAIASWRRAFETPHGQRDMSLQTDLEQRIRDAEDF